MEEQWRGWFVVVARHRDVRRQFKPYEELVKLQAFLSNWTIKPFDDQAADRFEQARADGVRIGTMDLKIASIALVHDALVLSQICRISSKRLENWLI